MEFQKSWKSMNSDYDGKNQRIFRIIWTFEHDAKLYRYVQSIIKIYVIIL